jgi:hypothetical protein
MENGKPQRNSICHFPFAIFHLLAPGFPYAAVSGRDIKGAALG